MPTDVITASHDGQYYDPPNAVYATIHDNANAGTALSDVAGNYIDHYLSAGNYHIARAGFIFDLTGLPSENVVSAAKVILYATAAGTWDGAQTAEIRNYGNARPSNPAVGADWNDALDSGSSGGEIAQPPAWAVGDNDIDLNATGIGWVQAAMGGMCRLMFRIGLDADDTPPTGLTQCLFKGVGWGTAAQRPRLSITHDAPPSATAGPSRAVETIINGLMR